jgi:hypothetical protein
MAGLWNEPLRARVDATFSEHQRALDKAEADNKQAFTDLRRNLEDKLQAGDEKLADNLASVKELLLTRVHALEQFSEQYHVQQQTAIEVATAEREKSADALRSQYEKAIRQSDEEREKSASALRNSLAREIQSGDENLRMHIETQISQVEATIESGRDLVNAWFNASKEAINKAETATEKRFKEVDDLRGQLGEFVPREVYDQGRADDRRRQDASLELMQSISLRVTEMEARGTERSSSTDDLKSTMAVGVAVVAVIVSGAIGLISLLGS